jgi:DNA-directed RNA polymerase specialized sigma24 family protein
MKAAHHETRTQLDAGKIRGAPMAYLLAILRTTAADQCRRLGLPPLKETRSEQRKRMALGGIPIEDLELAARLDGLTADDQVKPAHSATAPQRRAGRQERVVA